MSDELSQATEALTKIPHQAAEEPAPVEPNPPGDAVTERPDGATPQTEQAEPAIDPPASWSAEYAETFKTLPPALQKVISERESERESGVNRKLQEAAEQRKAYEARQREVDQYAQTYGQQLQTALQAVQAQIHADFPEVRSAADLVRLQREDPLRFQEFQARQMVVQESAALLQQQQQRQQAAQQKALQDWARGEWTKLTTEVPEWGKDEGLAIREMNEIRSHAIKMGIPEQEAMAPWSAPAVMMARESMLYRKAKSDAAKAKIANLPKVVKPGMAPEAGEAERARADAARSRLTKTGSLDDAAAALAARRATR